MLALLEISDGWESRFSSYGAITVNKVLALIFSFNYPAVVGKTSHSSSRQKQSFTHDIMDSKILQGTKILGASNVFDTTKHN